VRCEYCEGRAVVPVTDDKDVLADIEEYEADMREWQAEIDLESRMLGEY
jgi:predicted methyltransferase